MAGWNLKNGTITDYRPTEDHIWSLFNYVFSESCSKRNTYKFGLIKSLLDNAFNGSERSEGIFFSYRQLFARFAENYWNLVVKYDLRQMKPDGKSVYSKVETILKEAVGSESLLSFLEFSSLDEIRLESVIRKVTDECKKYVIGALYSDFDGIIYSFDLKDAGLVLNRTVYEFMLKYKTELEKLNYYSWAKFLERVNQDSMVVRVLDKLELATPKRSDLSFYREILRKEFEENTCFYCGRKLKDTGIHVDHFIPWSFVKDDKLWNFVLSCPTCNERKNNRLPDRDLLLKIEDRNRIIMQSDDIIVRNDFACYSDDLLDRMWQYARLSGLKEYSGNLRL
ncbi:HNH endonuclease [Ruminobacter amylophilus]|uniref:HNH endonuclease n=1 Tax=Ruminobacter amylophilus TaxID=867 RepID=UPI003866A7A2